MSDNMPTLWQNCLSQYRTEVARKAWIWFAETRGRGMLFDADAYANQVEQLVIALRPMLRAANRPFCAGDEALDDLMRFILIRHANMMFGGNVAPPFLTALWLDGVPG